ncbi:MAG: hypothetical protein QOD40_537 [Alphaproteobacteria bacterium]|jgi:hypothetical protein|nr:hypothetical protein [Alphaproteobacteria bacterium]
MTPIAQRLPAAFRSELALALFLVALDVVARTTPHIWNFMPVAATALFAGRTFSNRGLALLVPLAAMLLGDLIIGFDSLRMEIVIYASMLLPAAVGIASRRLSGVAVVVAAMLACSLFFFGATNFAVWAFGTMYPHTLAGLTQCFVAALPFLEKTVFGDLLWTAILFGGAWLMGRLPAASGSQRAA